MLDVFKRAILLSLLQYFIFFLKQILRNYIKGIHDYIYMLLQYIITENLNFSSSEKQLSSALVKFHWFTECIHGLQKASH